MPQVIEATETTALAVIETMSGAELFTPGTIDPILDRIKAEVRAVKTDISTDAGRKAVASLAFKVAKSKTFLDSVRKSLVEGEKKRLKAIDAEGSRIWDELEALQKEVRQPLTDWENAEKERIAGHEAAIAAIPESSMYGARETSGEVGARILYLESLYASRDWQEFGKRAKEAIAVELVRATDALARVMTREREASELARLRAEQVAREQREREEAIAKVARDKAEEEARKREAAALAAAERERQRIEAEKFEAEAKAKAVELAAIEAAEKAEAARVEAEARELQAQVAAAQAAESARIAARDAEIERQAAIARAAEYAKQVETGRIAAEEKAASERLQAKLTHEAQLARIERERIADAEIAAAQAKAREDALAVAERQRKNAWERAQDLERRRVEREKAEAEEKAKADMEAAVEAERQRVDAAKRKDAEEAEARARNRAHRAAINREIVQALMVADGVDEAIAKSIVQLIALGQVPHAKISY